MLRVLENYFQEHWAKVATSPKDAWVDNFYRAWREWPVDGQRDEWTQAWRAMVVRAKASEEVDCDYSNVEKVKVKVGGRL